MQLNITNSISITEANHDFSKVVRMVDQNGAAVILINNAPRYVVIEYNRLIADESTSDEDVVAVGARLLSKHHQVFDELAK